MAKNQNTNTKGKSGGPRRKSDSARKLIITLVALLLVMAIALTLSIGSFGFTVKNPNDWFKKPTVDAAQGGENNESTTRNKVDGAVIRLLDSNGSLTHAFSYEELVDGSYDAPISPIGDWDYYLTVTYDPKDATFQNTLFAASWNNPKSEWATGKDVNDYIEIKKVLSEETRATVTILQGFEEQIIIKATCEKQPEIYCTSTVDFLCTSIDIRMTNSIYSEDDYEVRSVKPIGGTIMPDPSNIYLYFKMWDRSPLIKELESAGYNQEGYDYEVSDTPERIESVFVPGIWIQCDYGILYESEGLYNWFNILCKLWGVSTNDTKFKNIVAKNFANGDTSDNQTCFSYGVVFKRAYKDLDFGWVTTNSYIDDVEAHNFEWLVTPANGMTPGDSGIVTG